MSQRTSRADLDAMIKISSVPADEPVWLTRAQDIVSGDHVRGWVALAHARGVDVAVLEQALRQADRMDAWPVKKRPEADHLAPDDRKALSHAFSRRAWRDHLDKAGVPLVPDFRTALAERRGYDEATGVIRALRRALEVSAVALEWQIAATAPGGVFQDADHHAALLTQRDGLVAPALALAEARHV
jgi:hypothetical protein